MKDNSADREIIVKYFESDIIKYFEKVIEEFATLSNFIFKSPF
jgi:hypothetical protein